MANDRIYNFSAGPSMLPLEVLEQAGAQITNFEGSGMSVMEMSHGSKVFLSIFEETKANFKRIFHVPDEYEVLFLGGGGTLQFAMAPMNLIGRTGKADYAITGSFSKKAYDEGVKHGDCRIAVSTADCNHTRIPKQEEIDVRPDASYFYYCCNNTIYGTEWNYVPEVPEGVELVSDMSSDILSRPVDISKFGVIFGGAQKNMGPAGVTVAIVKKSLAGHALPYTPVMLDYAAQIKGDSMHNTPPCWNIYVLGLVLKWLDKQGGVEGMQAIKHGKAQLLYDFIDNSKLYHNYVQPDSRSDMNVVFTTGDADLDKKFAAESSKAGMSNLNGHRSVGGMRASIYNAMPIEGVKYLIEFMKKFEQENG